MCSNRISSGINCLECKDRSERSRHAAIAVRERVDQNECVVCVRRLKRRMGGPEAVGIEFPDETLDLHLSLKHGRIRMETAVRKDT